MSDRHACDGACETHNGEIRKVRVFDPPHHPGSDSPWEFRYCETAIEADRAKGFRVEIVEETAP